MQRQHSLLGGLGGKQRAETKLDVWATTGRSSSTMRAASMFLLMALFTFATAWTAAAAGTGYTWTGSSSTAWNNSANWNPSTGIPGGSSSDTAGIPGSFSRYPVINTGAGTISAININSSGSGASLEVANGGSITVSTTFTVNANGTLTLTGTVSATGGVYPPIDENGTISAAINSKTVTGTFTNSTGAFVVYYDDPSLATDGVSGSPYTITYSYAGDSSLTAAADNTDTTLTVLPALTGMSSSGALDGYNAGTIPVVYVIKDSSGEITYSNVVLATTLTDDHTAFTITIGAPLGTKTVSLKPRFYLRKLFTFTDTVPVEDTGPLDITGAFFLGGDANGDNQVDATDYAWMRYWWGEDLAEWTSAVAGTGLEYDINGDGILDANDYPDFGGYGVIGAADYLILKQWLV